MDIKSLINLFRSDVGWVVGVVLVVLYAFYSFSMMKIAQRFNINHTVLAWIPVVHTFTHAKIAFEDNKKAGLILMLNLLTVFLITFAVVNKLVYMTTPLNILNFVARVFLFLSTYKIYKKLTNKPILWLLVSIFSSGLLTPVLFFAIRNNELKEK